MIKQREVNALNVYLNFMYLLKLILVYKQKIFQIVLNLKELINVRNVIKVTI